VIRSCWDYSRRHEEFLSVLDSLAQRAVVVNPPSLVRWNADKRYLVELQAAGLRVVPTWLPANSRQIEEIAWSNHSSELILKPRIAASSEGVRRIGTAQPIQVIDPMGGFLLQPYVREIETTGELSLVFIGGRYSHAARKLAAPGDFRVQAEFGGRVLSAVPTDEEQELATAVLSSLDEMPLYARVDLVDYQGRPHLMERELIEPELFFAVVPTAAVGLLKRSSRRFSSRPRAATDRAQMDKTRILGERRRSDPEPLMAGMVGLAMRSGGSDDLALTL
jgi:glutathione synthase/RimK-type ligase-like ATP-grasp enzyme